MARSRDYGAGKRRSGDSPQSRRLRGLARLLDSSIPLPGGYRIGLDGLIGLIPGVGDAIGASFSTYIILEAARMGASRTTLLRMVGNVLIDTIVGAVPILGDLFDFAWKANQRNMALLDGALEQGPAGGTPQQRLGFVGIVLLIALVVLIAVGVYLFIKLLLAIAAAIGGG